MLEAGNLLIRQGIGLGNDGYQIDLCMKTAHNLNVKRLERVAGGLDEIDASMDTVIHNVHAVDLVLCIEIGVKTLLNVLYDWAP